jgi:hypothetical protein
MTKAERKRTFKKAFTLYRRRGYDFSYRWTLYFNFRGSSAKSLKEFLRAINGQ